MKELKEVVAQFDKYTKPGIDTYKRQVDEPSTYEISAQFDSTEFTKQQVKKVSDEILNIVSNFSGTNVESVSVKSSDFIYGMDMRPWELKIIISGILRSDERKFRGRVDRKLKSLGCMWLSGWGSMVTRIKRNK